MASMIGKDIMEISERRARNNSSKGGNYSGRSNYSRGGSEKAHSKKPYDRNRYGRADSRQNSESRSVNRGPYDDRRYFKCDKVGHISRDCGKEVPPIRCFSCGEMGHKSPSCPSKQGVAVSSVGNAPSAAAKGMGVTSTSGRVFAQTKGDAETTPEVVTGTTFFFLSMF